MREKPKWFEIESKWHYNIKSNNSINNAMIYFSIAQKLNHYAIFEEMLYNLCTQWTNIVHLVLFGSWIRSPMLLKIKS